MNIKSLTIGAALFLFAALAHAGNVAVFADANDVTLAGHDAVAYFTENQAVEGSSEFTAVYDGAIYQFASAENRDTFKADPAKYAPQYGGFCAYGAAFGKKFDVDGKAFEVIDGKLFVNKNLDVAEAWQEDKANNIVTADQKWSEIKDVAAEDL